MTDTTALHYPILRRAQERLQAAEAELTAASYAATLNPCPANLNRFIAAGKAVEQAKWELSITRGSKKFLRGTVPGEMRV